MTELFTDAYAQSRDAADPLRAFRDEFFIPQHGGKPQAYFVGNSLGLQPKGARAHVEEVLDEWATEAVEGHFTGSAQWMPYHELVRDPLARVVGAQPSEVVAMNSLTANLHLMLVSFYQPTIERTAILVEAGSFPSDRYAVESQLKYRGLPPQHTLIEVEPDQPDGTFSMQAIERAIGENAKRLALILWPGVQYRTGQAFDLKEIARLAHAAGAIVGFDLAHAVGNLPLQLHDSGADFAVWCHYKYMNSGPGAVAGCFAAASTRPRRGGRGLGSHHPRAHLPRGSARARPLERRTERASASSAHQSTKLARPRGRGNRHGCGWPGEHGPSTARTLGIQARPEARARPRCRLQRRPVARTPAGPAAQPGFGRHGRSDAA